MADKQIKNLTAKSTVSLADFIPAQGTADSEAGSYTIQQIKDLFDTGGGVIYKELRASLFQTGTGAPSIQNQWVDTITHTAVNPSTDPLFKSISFARTGSGAFRVRISSNEANPVSNAQVDISFSDGKIRAGTNSTTASSPFSFSDFTFNSYDTTGTSADGVISFTNIYIRIYP